MGDVSKGAGKDRSAYKGPGDDVQGGSKCSASVWEIHMSSHRHDYGGPGDFPLQYHKTDCGDDGEEA